MSVTYELEILFLGEAAVAVATKRRVLERLRGLGITDFAEGVIDGVDLLIDSDDQRPSFEDDSTPVLVFDKDLGKLQVLAADLEGREGARLGFRHAALADESWQQAWDHGDQLIVTRQFVVWPQQRPGAKPKALTALVLARGEAFGSGRHATTQAALEALESLPVEVPRGPLLDVGTGTGILAIAAHHLGFRPLTVTEIDEPALAEAGRNALLNGVIIELLHTAEPPLGPLYAVITANILVPVLHHLLPRLKALLAPGGRLVLAGFIDKEAGPLLAAAAGLGLQEESREVCRGWVGLVLKATTSK